MWILLSGLARLHQSRRNLLGTLSNTALCSAGNLVDVLQLFAEHEALDPEYSILKQRLARRMRYDGLTDADLPDMDLVAITKVGCPCDQRMQACCP